MFIPELLENLPNDLERLIFLNSLKKQIDEQEKALKEKLLKTKPKHSLVKYVERKTWKPGGEHLGTINRLDTEKKAAIELSKKEKQGSFEVTNYIQISSPKPVKESPKSSTNSQDYANFFLGS